ncbi:MAG TPA: transglutaminase domain-containing protein [Myxococcaceae bacterium]
MRPPPRRSSGPGPLSWLFILVVLALALALPLLGAWVASTLVVHHEASREMAIAVGLGLSVVFPLAWELLSLPPRAPGGARPQRLLRMRTRLLLRTWAVNLLFMVGALLLSPRGVFTALSTRGDWMLPASGGPLVETTRRVLFKAADGVEWAYVLATDNPYRDQLIALAQRPTPRTEPRPVPPEQTPPPPEPSQPVPPPPAADAAKEPEPDAPTADAKQEPPLPDDDEGQAIIISWKDEPKPPEPTPVDPPASEDSPSVAKPPQQAPKPEKPTEVRRAGGQLTYPLPNQIHPAVTSLPRSVETDLATVAKYLVSQERDPFQRVKVLHDYVADRVVYDVEALKTGNFPSQRPEAVFQNRKGVCAGYSNLLAAMGQAVGEEIVSVSGDAYTPHLLDVLGEEFNGHAWNAVRIEGEWYLIDATWNAGHVNGDFYTRNYRTKYLFMPPQKFLERHLPDDPAWQLLDQPLSRGEAMRNARVAAGDTSPSPTPPPTTEPVAAKTHVWDHIRIRMPNRPRAEVKGRFHVELDNPKGLPAEVTLHNTQDGSQEPCLPEYGGARYACTVFGRGLYRIEVLSGPRSTNPQLMAQLEVQAL